MPQITLVNASDLPVTDDPNADFEIGLEFLKALADDSSYATAYNQMGYLYSRSREYDKAIQSMAKYVSLLPNEPNPHDSYGEMLRMQDK